MLSKTIKTVEASNIPIQDLTEVVLEGSGVFDKFLTLHRAVLDREFKQGRIVGKEYSDTFTRTYAANLEMAISFLLSKEKQAYEIELQEAQIKKMDADAELSLKQLELLTAKLPHEIRLMEATADKMVADAAVSVISIELAEKELILKEKQLDYQDKQLELLTEQLELQKQKIKTERAQTEAGIAEPDSIIATNVDTLKSQMLGIERDAKQKVLQLMLSTWTTRKNNDAAEENYQNLLTDDVIGAVIQDALGSIGYNIDVPDGEPGPRPTTPTEPNYVIP